MITKQKILSLIASAIIVAIVSVACGETPTNAGNISASTELSPVTSVPEQSGTFKSNLPTWDKNQSFNTGSGSNPEENNKGSKSALVGTWSGQYVTFWIDGEGNLNFDNVDTVGLWGNNSSYAGYKGKIADNFQYPYSIKLSFTPPANWNVEGEKTRTGEFVFTSPTSGYFTGGIVQKLGDNPYGWTTLTPSEGSVTKQ